MSAEKMNIKALEISEKTYGPDHMETVKSLQDLGLLHEFKKDYEGAERLQRRALAITQKQMGEKSKNAAEEHRRLGVVLRSAIRFEESSEEFQTALNVFELLETRKSLGFKNSLLGMGKLKALQNNFPEAKKLFTEALEISRELFQDDAEDIENHLKAAREGKAI